MYAVTGCRCWRCISRRSRLASWTLMYALLSVGAWCAWFLYLGLRP